MLTFVVATTLFLSSPAGRNVRAISIHVGVTASFILPSPREPSLQGILRVTVSQDIFVILDSPFQCVCAFAIVGIHRRFCVIDLFVVVIDIASLALESLFQNIPFPVFALRLLRLARLLRAGRVIQAVHNQKKVQPQFYDVKLYNGHLLRRIPLVDLIALDAKSMIQYVASRKREESSRERESMDGTARMTSVRSLRSFRALRLHQSDTRHNARHAAVLSPKSEKGRSIHDLAKDHNQHFNVRVRATHLCRIEITLVFVVCQVGTPVEVRLHKIVVQAKDWHKIVAFGGEVRLLACTKNFRLFSHLFT